MTVLNRPDRGEVFGGEKMSERSGCSKQKCKREKEEGGATFLRSVPSIQTFFKRSQEHQDEDDTAEEEDCLQANPELEEDAMGSECQPVATCSLSTSVSQSGSPSTTSTYAGSSHERTYQVSDLALWAKVNAHAVLIDRGPATFHNRTRKYLALTCDGSLGSKVRSFTNDLLYCRLPDGERVSCDWMTYSPSTGNIC